MTKSFPSEKVSLSFDDMCILLQLVDMATSALDRHDFPQLDTILRKISVLRARNMQTRALVDTLSRRRGLGPCSVPG